MFCFYLQEYLIYLENKAAAVNPVIYPTMSLQYHQGYGKPGESDGNHFLIPAFAILFQSMTM